MKKRILSIVLAVALILCLVPVGVLAADNGSSVNPATGREQGPAGDIDVAVMVYGNTMTDLVLSHEGGFEAFTAALEGELKNLVGNENVPKVEMYLVNDETNQEYRLTEQSVSDASFLSSFKYEVDDGSILGFSETIFGWIQALYGWLVSDLDEIESLYRIYGAPNVPEGTYTLEIRNIEDEGYTLENPGTRHYKVQVKDNAKKTCYVGFDHYLGSAELKFSVDLIIWEFEVNVIDATFSMPGVFLRSQAPGVEFTSANLGEEPVPGSEFVMVNRDETEKIIKAAYSLGKGTFENAMSLLGTEGFTWEELSILHNEVLKWDEENAQISIDGKNAYKLLGTYWALMQASAKDPLLEFIRDDTDLHVPAILQATADENGVVHFGPENNVTLIWSLELLMKAGGIALEKAEEMELIDEVFPDPTTNAIINLFIDLGKNLANSETPLWDADGNIKADNVNTWVYLILQNDNVMEYAQDALKWLVGDELSEEEKEFLNLLPNHALLTKKMPAGKYILFETSVPDGYFRSPFFYTIDLQWHPDSEYASDWYYASIANLGIVGPYFAEDYYDWLRQYDFKAQADKVLNYITKGTTGNLIANTLTGKEDLTKYTITFYSNIVYNYLGGDLLYNSEAELAKAMTKHFYAYGKTAQNLLVFGNQVAEKSKTVITGKVDRNWTFYNYSTSLRTNSTLRTHKILKGVANAIDTTDDHPVTSSVKSIVQRITDRLDTSNRIIGITTAVQNAVRNFLKDTASNIGNKVIDGVANLMKTIIGWSKL